MKRLLISNTLSTQLFAFVGIIGAIYGFNTYGLTTQSAILILLGYFLYLCCGVIVTFHRQLCHKSYKTYDLITKILSFFGCMANTGSSIVWVAIHIKHHLKSDKEGDPHSPHNKGYSYFLLDYPIDQNIRWRMRDIIKDPYQKFLHRNYNLLLISYSLLLFLIGGWYLMIFFHWIPSLLCSLMSNIVNYAGHKESWWGTFKTYKLSDHSVNNWIWALPSWGESWHNNHHRFPRSYTTSQKWYQVDIAGWVIKIIKLNEPMLDNNKSLV